jgi:hypothetical protein
MTMEQTQQTQTSSGDSVTNTLSTIFTDFDKNMDTYIKKTPRLPTGAEFLSDFENAFNTRLNDLLSGPGADGLAGSLGPNEAEFARNVLFPQLFSQYQSKLGQIAKTGASPFRTAPGGKSTQTIRSRGGSSTNRHGTRDTSGGGTRTSTTTDDEGNTTTTISDSGEGGRENFNETDTESTSIDENQTIEEDILLPKVMPLDYLAEALTPAAIKVAYEGSRRGAGQFQSAGTGATIARRV